MMIHSMNLTKILISRITAFLHAGLSQNLTIHMPKEAARIFLRVTDVRVERLQDMNMNDIQDEGVVPNSVKGGQWQQWQRDYMKPVWNSIVKKSDLNKYGWNANPWVWVTKFEKINKEDTPWKENTTR